MNALGAVLSLVLAAPATADAPARRVSEGKNRFSLEVPAAWKQVEDAVLGPLGGLSFRRDEPAATLKAVAADFPFEMDLKDYVENSTSAYRSIWTIEERASVTLGTAPAERMVIVQTIGADRKRLLKYFVARPGGVVVLTLGADPGAFAGSLAGFESIARSIQLKR